MKIITIATIDVAAQGKFPTLLKSVNTGGSSITVTFNNDSWGNISRSFTKSMAKVAQSIHQFEKIENAAKKISRGTTQVTEMLKYPDSRTCESRVFPFMDKFPGLSF